MTYKVTHCRPARAMRSWSFPSRKDPNLGAVWKSAFDLWIANGISGFLNRGIVKLSLFVVLASLAIYFLYLRKLLQHLDPSQVIPERVRATLDTFAEGLLVLDSQERIVLANQSFALTVGQSPSALQGRPISELEWKHPEDSDKCAKTYPWQWALTKGMPKIGTMLNFPTKWCKRTNIHGQFLAHYRGRRVKPVARWSASTT